MRVIRCKRCASRMWDDQDGTIYCPNCGWECGMKIDPEQVVEALAQREEDE